MKKRIIFASIALVCVVGLGVTAWWLTMLPENTYGGDTSTTTAPATRQRTPTILLERTLGENASAFLKEARVELHGHGDDSDKKQVYTIAPNESGTLYLDTLKDLPLNTAVLQTFMESISHLETLDTIDEAPENAASYGFDTPEATVHVRYGDDTLFSFALCPLPLSSDSNYYLQVIEDSTGSVTTGADSPVYLLHASEASPFLAPQEDYVALDVWMTPNVSQGNEEEEYPSLTVRELKLAGTLREQPTIVRRRLKDDRPEFSAEVYLIEKPYLTSASNEEQFLSSVMSTNALSAAACAVVFPTAEQLAEYGLDNPYSVAAYTLSVMADKKDQTGAVVSTRYHSDVTNLVKLGKKNDAGQYYAQINQVEAIYLVNADSVPWATLTYQELAAPNVFLRNVIDVERLDITHNGKTTALQLTHYPEKTGDDKLVITANGDETLDTADFRKLYQLLMNIRRTGISPAEPTGDPLFRIVLTPNKEGYSALTVSIYAHSASSYICQTDQGDTFKVSASNVDTVMKQYERYLAGDIVVM